MNNVKKYTEYVEKIKHGKRMLDIQYTKEEKMINLQRKRELQNAKKLYEDVISSTNDPNKRKALEFKLKKEQSLIRKNASKRLIELEADYRKGKITLTKNYNIFKNKLDDAIKSADKRKKTLKSSSKGVKGYISKGKKGIVDTAKKAGESWKSIPGKKPIFISAAILSAALSAALYKRYRDLENQRMKQLGLIK